jgi:hypothetical protein
MVDSFVRYLETENMMRRMQIVLAGGLLASPRDSAFHASYYPTAGKTVPWMKIPLLFRDPLCEYLVRFVDDV